VWGIREKTSLLPRSCAPPGHLPALGVSSRPAQPPATGKGSVSHDRAVVAVPVPIDAMDVVTWLLDDLGRQAVTQSLKSLTGRKCLRNDPF
jgi:hypothetical protein